ncbi:unnamed protein product [Calypogeia fissa]
MIRKRFCSTLMMLILRGARTFSPSLTHSLAHESKKRKDSTKLYVSLRFCSTFMSAHFHSTHSLTQVYPHAGEEHKKKESSITIPN